MGQKPWGAPDTRATDAKPLENQTLWICRSKGISSPTEVHFVITKGWINFYEFARFFRDGLGCSNALFLDGGEAPWLYAPELGRNDAPGHGGYGPIIAGEVGPDFVAQRSHRFGIPELLRAGRNHCSASWFERNQ